MPIKTDTKAPKPEELLEQLAQETYQNGYEIIYNRTKTAVLVRKAVKSGAGDSYPTIYFFLYDLKTQEQIHQDVVIRAEVKWIGPEEVSVLSVPGVMRDDDPEGGKEGYIYNVTTRTKRRIGN